MTSLIWNLDPDAVTVNERIILLCLGDYCNRHGREAWPAISTVVRRTSLTRRTVQRGLNRLKVIGLLVPAGRTRSGTVVYRLNQDRLFELGLSTEQEGGAIVARVEMTQRQPDAPPAPERHQGGATVARGGRHPDARSGIEPVLNRKRTVAAFAAKRFPPSDKAEKAEKTEAETTADRLANLAQLAVFLKTAVKSMP
jgi:hypothetical protein